MTGLLALIVCSTFFTITLLAYGLALYTHDRRTLKERYRGAKANTGLILPTDEKSDSFKKRLLKWISSLGKMAIKDQVGVPQLRASLCQAGFRHVNAPAIYFGLRAVSACSLPLPYIFLTIWQGEPNPLNLSVSFLLAAVGYQVPTYLLQVMIRRRQDRLDRALPDVLDLMVVSMEAGLGLQSTMNRVADEIRVISPDLYTELQITNGELRTGIPREDALKKLGDRTGVQSVKALVALMIQSERMGASISQALRTQADFIRVQRAQKAEEIAGKLPVKILFPLMFFILPALFIVILGPAAIKMSKTIFR